MHGGTLGLFWRSTVKTRLRILSAAVVLFMLAAAGLCQTPMPPEKTALVLGQSIHYYEAGQGPVVILLHGLGANAGIWAANIAPLSAHYQVIALDQVGFGHSAKPLLDYKIATFVDFLYGFMQSQQIEKATLVGNSLGGWVALDFAVQHPAMVDKLVLVDAGGLHFGAAAPTVDLNPSSVEGMKKILEYVFYDHSTISTPRAQAIYMNHLKDNDGYTIHATIEGVFSTDQFEEPKLPSLHTPTLIVWGANDALIPLAKGEEFHTRIAGSKLVTIEQCGHMPQLEKPEEFNRAVLEFLRQP